MVGLLTIEDNLSLLYSLLFLSSKSESSFLIKAYFHPLFILLIKLRDTTCVKISCDLFLRYVRNLSKAVGFNQGVAALK